MSNTLGTLSGTLVLQKALELTFRKRPNLNLVSLGFKDLDGKANAAMLNQSVVSRIKTVATVNDFGTGAGNVVDTDVTCTLNAKKEIHFALTPDEYNATDRNLVEELAQPMAVGLANYIVDAQRDLWLERYFPNTSGNNQLTVASGWTYANTLVAARTKMAKLGIPADKRFLAANADVYGALLGDTTVVANLYNPNNNSAIMNGQLPRVSDMALAEYPDVSVNAGASAAIASANTSTEVITCSAAHGFVTGQRVNLTVTSGLTGLTDGTSYYVIYVSATTLKLATTSANAVAGTAVNITADGTGTLTDCRIGFAGSPDSTVYLARPMRDPRELAPGLPFNGNMGYITDPVTGFTVLVTQWINTDTLVLNSRMSWLEGRAVGNPNNGIIIYNK